jgi:hypothetical protein
MLKVFGHIVDTFPASRETSSAHFESDLGREMGSWVAASIS